LVWIGFESIDVWSSRVLRRKEALEEKVKVGFSLVGVLFQMLARV